MSSIRKAHFNVPGMTTAGAGHPPSPPSSAGAPLLGADDRGLTPGPTAHSRLPPFLHGQGSHPADAQFSAAPLISEFGSQCVRLSVHCHGHRDPFAAAGRSPDGRWEDLACLRPPPPSSRDPGRGSQPLGFPARVLREGPGLRARRPATARAHAPAASPWVQDWAAPARALVQAPRLSAPQPPAPVESWGGTEARCSSKYPLAVSSPGLANAPVRSGARRDWRCSLRANGTRAKLVGKLGHAIEVGAAPTLAASGEAWARAGLGGSCTARGPGGSGGPRTRECIFGRGQDLGWSLAFYGEEADWEGPSARLSCCATFPRQRRARGTRGCTGAGEGALPGGSGDSTVGSAPRVGPPRSRLAVAADCHVMPLSPNTYYKSLSCASGRIRRT